MEHRQLGHNGPNVSVIGLGCNQLGLDATAPGRKADHRLLERALELGINHFDTADSYTHGDSERILGEFRRRHPEVLVATKVGFFYRPTNPVQRLLSPAARAIARNSPERRRRLIAWERSRLSPAFSPSYIARAVENSLRRLATDCLDVLYLHSPPASTIEQGDAFDIIKRLRDAGKIRYLGFSIRSGQSYPLDALAQVNFQAIQLPLSPGKSTDADVLLPWARAHGIGTVVNMPFDKGTTLTPRSGNWGLLANGSSRSLAQAAMRYALQNPNVTCTIPGTSKISHLEENAAAANSPPLTAQEEAHLVGG
jgi:aryl-alcohol dehydrogenase-like predicted oxidoreductase